MYEELIKTLRDYPDREESADGYVEVDWQDLLDAADAIVSLTEKLTTLKSNTDSQTQTNQAILNQLADLTVENVEKDKEIERLESGGTFKMLRQTQRELSRVETERDAAVDFIQHIDRECGRYIADAGFERWRGVQGEE